MKTEEQFPDFDAATSGKDKKKLAKLNQVNAKIAQAEEVDPARGKPSSFFVVMAVNPTMPADP